MMLNTANYQYNTLLSDVYILKRIFTKNKNVDENFLFFILGDLIYYLIS